MRIIALVLALLFAPLPVAAEDPSEGEGTDLMAEALRLVLLGLMREMEPALDDWRGLLDNLDAYHPPEVLPNGDIIIRRKQRPEEPPEGETEI